MDISFTTVSLELLWLTGVQAGPTREAGTFSFPPSLKLHSLVSVSAWDSCHAALDAWDTLRYGILKQYWIFLLQTSFQGTHGQLVLQNMCWLFCLSSRIPVWWRDSSVSALTETTWSTRCYLGRENHPLETVVLLGICMACLLDIYRFMGIRLHSLISFELFKYWYFCRGVSAACHRCQAFPWHHFFRVWQSHRRNEGRCASGHEKPPLAGGAGKRSSYCRK